MWTWTCKSTGVLHGALILSNRANAMIDKIDKSQAMAIDGVEYVITVSL